MKKTFFLIREKIDFHAYATKKCVFKYVIRMEVLWDYCALAFLLVPAPSPHISSASISTSSCYWIEGNQKVKSFNFSANVLDLCSIRFQNLYIYIKNKIIFYWLLISKKLVRLLTSNGSYAVRQKKKPKTESSLFFI